MAKKKQLSEDVEVEALEVIKALGMYKGQRSVMKRSRYDKFKEALKLIGDYEQGGGDTTAPTEQDGDNGDNGATDLQEPGQPS